MVEAQKENQDNNKKLAFFIDISVNKALGYELMNVFIQVVKEQFTVVEAGQTIIENIENGVFTANIDFKSYHYYEDDNNYDEDDEDDNNYDEDDEDDNNYDEDGHLSDEQSNITLQYNSVDHKFIVSIQGDGDAEKYQQIINTLKKKVFNDLLDDVVNKAKQNLIRDSQQNLQPMILFNNGITSKDIEDYTNNVDYYKTWETLLKIENMAAFLKAYSLQEISDMQRLARHLAERGVTSQDIPDIQNNKHAKNLKSILESREKGWFTVIKDIFYNFFHRNNHLEEAKIICNKLLANETYTQAEEPHLQKLVVTSQPVVQEFARESLRKKLPSTRSSSQNLSQN
jgi:hypothetical protein